MFIAMFSAADDELTKQRAADVRDIKSGVLGILLGVNEIKVSDAPKGTVLVARELTPSVTAGIVKENIAGIITETGGTTSHSAILARALEIPAVLSVEGVASSLKNGDTVVVDGSEGAVIVNPDDNTVAEYSKKRDAFLAERKELENYRGRETKSASGEVYELFCNIGKPEDAVKAVDADGEGVGLFRTEFLFMDRTSIPTEDEQFEAYKKAALILKGKSLIIRTHLISAVTRTFRTLDLKKKKIRSWDSVQSDIALKTVNFSNHRLKPFCVQAHSVTSRLCSRSSQLWMNFVRAKSLLQNAKPIYAIWA